MRNRASSRRRVPAWCLVCLLLMGGCQSIRPAAVVQRARSFENEPPIQLVDHQEKPQFLPASVPETKAAKPIPVSLDTVLRLAQDQNGQVRLARLKLDDAFTDQYFADKHWLPDLSIGLGTYRHDGGIQDFQGNLLRTHYGSTMAGVELTGKYDWKEHLFRRVEVERRVWQQKGELSRLTSENLLEASTVYISLLAARSGVAVSLETEIRLKDLLDQTKKLAGIDSGLQVEVSRIETELMAQTVLTVKLRELSKAASAKLAYLIGLDPCCEILVADGKAVPILLVDARQPVHKLVDQALTQGPGVRELEGLLGAVEDARDANYGLRHWMPSVELNLIEGGFGASPGTSAYEYANRFDLGFKFKWNLREFATSKQKRRQADANIEQVRLTYDDLRAKLTLGVQEAHDAIKSGMEQIDLAERHIKSAEESYRLSDQRLKDMVKGRSSSEVLLALRTLSGARLEYLQAVREQNRAQLRLFVLVGAAAGGEPCEMRIDRPRHHQRP